MALFILDQILNITKYYPRPLDRYDNDFEKYISSKMENFRTVIWRLCHCQYKDKVFAETLSSQNLAANEIQIDASLNALQILKDHQSIWSIRDSFITRAT